MAKYNLYAGLAEDLAGINIIAQKIMTLEKTPRKPLESQRLKSTNLMRVCTEFCPRETFESNIAKKMN